MQGQKNVPLLVLATMTLFLSQAGILSASTVCINFGPPPTLGTRYGPLSGQHPDDVVLVQQGILVRIEVFLNPGLPSAFDLAEIVPPGNPPGNFGIGQRLRIRNINVKFILTEVGFKIHHISFEYAEQGGIENLSVNGRPIFAGRLSSAPSMIGGARLRIGPTTPIPGGRKGKVFIVGNVSEFEVGGQEFWLDDVCVSN